MRTPNQQQQQQQRQQNTITRPNNHNLKLDNSILSIDGNLPGRLLTYPNRIPKKNCHNMSWSLLNLIYEFKNKKK
ncbi:hypothetical protein DERF_011897 [Dermatophagoides farinae]|uniref:Uncharacterized protein n=1 Tax=Dermatophagoides farinae TaxID=6954 RepID=A0A922HT06_DERFA|nr:hypothetical protein DERF_011897 [Dermatophagoides farinae]